jgi:hypothetical protein
MVTNNRSILSIEENKPIVGYPEMERSIICLDTSTIRIFGSGVCYLPLTIRRINGSLHWMEKTLGSKERGDDTEEKEWSG